MAAKREVVPTATRAPSADPFDDQPASEELAALWRLGPEQLRRRWRTLIGRSMPSGLGRQLALRILAYHEQAQRHGDLDQVSRRALAEMAGGVVASTKGGGRDAVGDDAIVATSESVASVAKPARKPYLPRRGTVLAREHGGVRHRVLVGEDGFSWQGQSYDSLSKVALAITGTRWNGPRFFGLRDAPARTRGNKPCGRSNADASVGKGAAGRAGSSGPLRPPSQGAAP